MSSVLVYGVMLVGLCMAEEPICHHPGSTIDCLKKLELFVTEKLFAKITQLMDKKISELTKSEMTARHRLEAKFEGTTVRIGFIQHNQMILTEKITNVENDVMKTEAVNALINAAIRKSAVPFVWFFARNPHNSQRDGRVIFRDVVHNEGRSYDETTGVFTCNIPGLYHFAFTFMSDSDISTPYCTFYRNDTYDAGAYAKGVYNSATMVLYHYLSVGDTIHVRCGGWDYIFTGRNHHMWITGSLIHT